jgi:alcohol dehydrogenase (cytochrome c)/quinohemoprotein ethanol dehydrogenase
VATHSLVNWNTGIHMRPDAKVVKEARYAGGSWNLAPGVQGGHGWHSNAFSPDTGLIYVPTQRAYFPLVEAPYTVSAVGYNLGIDFTAPGTYYLKHPKEPSTFVGYLQAGTRSRRWSGKARPMPAGRGLQWGPAGNGPTGGAMATAGGLVFAARRKGRFQRL